MISYLPSLPTEVDAFARLAVLLIAAIALAEVAERLLRLPRLTGYVFAGILMGPTMLNWVPLGMTGELRPLMLLGVGLLLFELGTRVDVRWLAHNPLLIVTSLVESALTFAAVYVLLSAFELSLATRVSVAAIAVGTGATVVMRIVTETNARGQMTERLLLLTALNSLYAILLLKLSFGYVHLEQQENALEAVLHPVYSISGSFLLAALIAYGMHLASFSRLRRENERFTLVIAVVLLGTTVADALELSVPLALLCGGMMLRVRSRRLQLFPEHFGSAGALLVLSLFALTGVELDPAQLLAGGVISVGVVLVRAATKYAAAWLSAGPGGLTPEKSGWLGVGLWPMSSLAVLHAFDVSDVYRRFGEDVVTIVLGAVLVMEIVGPIATQIALRRTGEAAPRDETRS
jgi:Kef-type K+ transport system membrane component KefB